MKAFRGAVYGAGFGLIAWGLGLAFFVTWFWVAIVIGATLITAAGLAEYVAQRSAGDDCGFDDTVFGWGWGIPPTHVLIDEPPPLSENLVHVPGVALTVIEGGKRPVWPSTAGAPE